MKKTENKLRIWEAALLLGMGLAMLCGMWLNGEQAALADRVIRLHVVANSDSEEDQALKLLVRDRVLAVAETLYRPEDTVETAYAKLEENLSLLAETGSAALREQGSDLPVAATLERTWFPTKEYTDFALPAGNYTALRIRIGAGEGKNWWCVVFPPLCLGSVSEEVEQTALAGGFSHDQVSLITGENEGYVVKFKLMELWENWKARAE